MILARTREELERGLREVRREGGRLGLVPTMGALHEGHLSLVRRARDVADQVAISIFVNPTQFGPEEDYGAYPRDEEGDAEKAEAEGVSLVFAPGEPSVIYPDGEPRIVPDPGTLADRLCGAYRPGHFRGVLTVVAKLFGLVRPDVAVLGRKDFQQTVLVRRMVRDLELGVEIEVAPIVREADGLARSSRNAYLTPEERRQAPALFRGLRAARDRFRGGERRAPPLLDAVRRVVGSRALMELQYVEVVEPGTLEVPDPVIEGSVAAAAAFCGETRLIDNVVLE